MSLEPMNESNEKSPQYSLLDLFCGAGGAAMGYHQAGFSRIVGIDNKPQKRYPFEFIQADALDYCAEHGHEFDVVHASPPCQRYSQCTPLKYREKHPDLIDLTREALKATERIFIIENVEGARGKLISPIKLCGSMFGLKIWRHRYFEIWPAKLWLTPPCDHKTFTPILVSGTPRRKGEKRKDASANEKREAMQVPWMVTIEMDEAIPPAYTEWLGIRVLEMINE